MRLMTRAGNHRYRCATSAIRRQRMNLRGRSVFILFALNRKHGALYLVHLAANIEIIKGRSKPGACPIPKQRVSLVAMHPSQLRPQRWMVLHRRPNTSPRQVFHKGMSRNRDYRSWLNNAWQRRIDKGDASAVAMAHQHEVPQLPHPQ